MTVGSLIIDNKGHHCVALRLHSHFEDQQKLKIDEVDIYFVIRVHQQLYDEYTKADFAPIS